MNRTVSALLAIVGLGIHTLVNSQASNPYAKVPAFGVDNLPAADVRLIQTLNRHGIPVIDFGGCHPAINASYDPTHNVVVICSNVYDNDVSDTIRHEAVHAAQDCKAGKHNSELSLLFPHINPFLNGTTDSTTRAIEAAYAEEHHALEWEAWHVAANSTSDEVTAFVDTYCE